MSYRYAVLGCGQGAATAYDLARFGEAREVYLLDIDGEKAHQVAKRLNALLGRMVVCPGFIDATDEETTRFALSSLRVDAVVGAISYKMNEVLSRVAIDVGAHYIDLGGNTDVVRKQHKLDEKARVAEVTIVPDCGMGPGFNLSLANAVASYLETPKSITVYCGGLPAAPEGPLNYALFFSMGGLVNEYSGYADILYKGKRARRMATEQISEKHIQGMDTLEASHTSGGLSTAPWTFPSLFPSLRDLEYKTLRYPGHFEQIRAWKKAGVLRERLVELLGESLSGVPDIGVIRVEGMGKDGITCAIDVCDRFDAKTGFSAMQRLTGFHASVIAIMAAKRKIDSGVLSVESIDGDRVIREMSRRGILATVESSGGSQM